MQRWHDLFGWRLRWPAISLLVLLALGSVVPARAAEVKPCEPDKLATRYPGLVGQTIAIGQDGASIPFSYRDATDPNKLIGVDADYSRAVFACIGVPVKFVIGPWSGLLPAVAEGRIDVMWANLYYTPERAKMVDFVLYAKAQDAALVHKGNPKELGSLDDLCGTRALAGLGTIELNLLKELTAKCTAGGKQPIEVISYQDKPSAWQMVETNRADVVLSSSALVEAISAQKPDTLQMGFKFLPDIRVGVGVKKGRTEFEQAIFDSVAATHANGEAAKIYAQYKLDPALIREPEILTK